MAGGREELTAAVRAVDQRDAALPVHALLLVVALAAAVTRQGAYYATGQRLLGVLLVAAVVAAAWASPLTRRDLRQVPVVACAALAGWALVSAAVAGDLAGAWPPIALLAGVAAVIVVCRRVALDQRAALVAGIVALGVLCALSGWVGVAWRLVPWTWEDQGLWRASTTLTYANATAGLLVPLALVALARLVARPRSTPTALAVCLLVVGVAATLSRAGVFALVIGLTVLGALVGAGRLIRAGAPPAVGALFAFLGLAPSMPATSPPRPLLALAGLAAGLGLTAALSGVTGRARAGIAVGGVLGLAMIAIALGGPVGDAVRDIRGPRLTLQSSDRADETMAAARLVADRPVTGTGPGGAVLLWTDPDGQQFYARWAHNEYLQVAAELGIPGLLLLGALIFTVGRTVARGRRWAGSPEVWGGLAAALVALAIHSAFDFLWHVSAIPLLAALLVGLTVAPVDQPSTPKETT